MYGQNNNGFYTPYNPYYPQNAGAMPDALTSYKQPYQMPQMPVKTTNELLWALNENEAASYPVAPNNTVILWDKNNPIIYVKSVDAQGVPSFRILDFKERVQGSKGMAEAEYVKKEEFNALQEKFAELAEKFESNGGK